MKELNFLPRTFVEARRRARILRMQSLAIVAVLAALVAILTTSQIVLGRVKAETRNAGHTGTLLERQVLQMQTLKRDEADLLRQQEIQRRLGNWVPRSSVLLLVSRILPQGVGVVELSIKPKRPKNEHRLQVGLNETTPDVRSRGRGRGRGRARRRELSSEQDETYTEITLTGIAPSDVHIARVVADMEAHAAFAGVRLLYSRHRLADERVLREFQLNCRLVEKELETPGE